MLLAVLAAAAVLSGCSLPRPPGDGTIRYRDQVFGNVNVTRDIQYGSAPDLSGNPVALKMDLYRPVGDTATKRPVVIWVHGGSFCCGDKIAADMVDLATNFAKLGYVTASINYRLLATSACSGSNVTQNCVVAAMAAQHDAQAAVRWFRANAASYGIDPTRIGIGGSSAGAVTSVEVGINSGDPGDSGNPGYSSKVGGFMSLSGGVPAGYESYFDSADSPGMFFHGTADSVVPYQWAAIAAAQHAERRGSRPSSRRSTAQGTSPTTSTTTRSSRSRTTSSTTSSTSPTPRAESRRAAADRPARSGRLTAAARGG